MGSAYSSERPRTIGIVAGGLGGAVVAVWNFMTPLTGVTGTFGAGLVIASSILIVIAGLWIQITRPGGLRLVLRILVALGALGTAAAGYFLHEWWLIVAMVVVALGLIYDLRAGRSLRKSEVMA
ncbi:hypothetical protein [Thioclava sp. GXIMD2076]|uniref:hypothetical protein n=1 Tax=unclassified Thioclava TaxID=2621713 RepID=UPI0030D54CE4